ncbi:MAG: hypothetical protein OXE79_11220 [Acidimicrobiaceae bacterium]|nr:hypothetical protein [Acidimicrobiaceae bacterium]
MIVVIGLREVASTVAANTVTGARFEADTQALVAGVGYLLAVPNQDHLGAAS